jgi:hypothetical protein
MRFRTPCNQCTNNIEVQRLIEFARVAAITPLSMMLLAIVTTGLLLMTFAFPFCPPK